MMDIKHITILYPGRAKCEVFQTDSAPSGLNRSGIYFASSPFSYYIKIFTNLLITTRRAGQSFFPLAGPPAIGQPKQTIEFIKSIILFIIKIRIQVFFFEKKKMDETMKRNPNFGHSLFSMAPSIKHQNMIFHSI